MPSEGIAVSAGVGFSMNVVVSVGEGDAADMDVALLVPRPWSQNNCINRNIIQSKNTSIPNSSPKRIGRRAPKSPVSDQSLTNSQLIGGA